MRRHDYTVEVLGGATGANYSTDYKEFQGIKMPTTRRVYAYDGEWSENSRPAFGLYRHRNYRFFLEKAD